MTRAMEALSPLLNHPRKMIIQVEALVTAATALLFLQLILGSCKRRWHNSIVKVVLSLSNAVMFPLILYTLGVMQSSPIKNSVYPVLAVSLLMAAGGTNAVRQYDFNDKKKLLEYVIEMARYSHNGKIVANWMKKQTNDDHQNDSDPESLKGYNYPVRYKPLGLHGNGVITVDQIWSCCSNSDNGKALKDVCLSFALFELLKRRHFGFVCAEASLPETKDFVFKCLLPTENHYKRAFRIIEMELGFCYDFFFTKYHSIYIAWMAPQKPAAEVSGTMKMYIARSLISTHGNLTNGETSLISTNVKLGKQLELLQDGNQCWKVLADFWAEAIIYIAPSHMTVKQHMEHLENGGEFLTQIWAMLSHCGILNLESDKDQGAKPDQFTPEIV
ncbi:hypothetical protein PR202_gb28320 [Eleusine coracana subsp. coracana]|uniref:DUF4220 domain-containing protein n=1 Tax=Eleusine coracana subsp. coracana TaxID=191504 RepID=A0AAV5FWN4_ELECO|nr:hypothetical protein PR202_gb28320 [Eleusine coracana subsp. coracana]